MRTIIFSILFMGFFSSLFGRDSKPDKPTNRLAKTETVAVDGPNGPTHAILMSIDAPDAKTFGTLMPTIVSTFKDQRMISPPDTSLLLITVIGEVSAGEFKRQWDTQVADDAIVEAFMSRMTKADVLHVTPDGEPLDSMSLRK